MPQSQICLHRIRRVVSLSTIITTLLPIIWDVAAGESNFSFTAGALMVKWKLEPVPSLDYAQILPFIISTSLLDIASPRPVPPYSLEVDGSIWLKGRNRSFMRFCGMPIPVSRTSN